MLLQAALTHLKNMLPAGGTPLFLISVHGVRF
jgi:hypothetical protein